MDSLRFNAHLSNFKSLNLASDSRGEKSVDELQENMWGSRILWQLSKERRGAEGMCGWYGYSYGDRAWLFAFWGWNWMRVLDVGRFRCVKRDGRVRMERRIL